MLTTSSSCSAQAAVLTEVLAECGGASWAVGCADELGYVVPFWHYPGTIPVLPRHYPATTLVLLQYYAGVTLVLL